MLIGESGIGKSALLANWGKRYRNNHDDVKVLMHFTGASALSGDWMAMLRRIMGELQESFDLQAEIPQDPNELRRAFPDWVSKASQKGKIVLLLDGLDQLEDKQGAQELTWLQFIARNRWHDHLQLYLGKSLDSVKDRGYSCLTIELLTRQEREQVISQFLAQFSKRLNSKQLEKILDNLKTSNPLTLRIMLDELRQFGSFEKLDEVIDRFLEADSINDVLKLVFERFEKDFETERPGLVKDTLCYIWAARQGLSESELLHLLGKADQPLAQGIWSPLHLALEELIESIAGILKYSHQYIRNAVETLYLKTEDEKRAYHHHLAVYFHNQDEFPKRKVVELPWQWQHSKDWQRLYDLLLNPDFFLAQWFISRNDLFTYWVAVEANTDFHREKAYESILERIKNPIGHFLDTDQTSLLNGIAVLLMDTGYLVEALDY